MWIIVDNLSTRPIFSSVSSETGRPDGEPSLTSSLPSRKRLVHMTTVGYDGVLAPKAVATSSLIVFGFIYKIVPIFI